MSRVAVVINPLVLLALAAYAAGTLAFLAFCAVSRQPLSASIPMLLGAGVALVLVAAALAFALRRGQRLPPGSWALATLIAALVVLALAAFYQVASYLAVPVDLLSFAESPFVTDILKLRLGIPVYTPVADNNSYPYTPGAQILTYAVAAALGHPESIPVYRAVQFSFVVLAAAIASSICDLLARQLLSPVEYRQRPLWIAVWLPWLFLVAIDPRFNPYNHSLHNDGLALLFSMAAFWMMARYALRPGPVLFWVMAIWPAIGFLAKQSQMIWLVIFGVYFVVLGGTPGRRLARFLLCGVAAWGAAVGLCFLLWDRPFLYWVFGALGDKQVSVLRSLLHLRDAGLYACLGLVAGGLLVRANPSRAAVALWSAWLLVFAVEAYTSGLGWVTNHLGPGIVLASCWFLVLLVRAWPAAHGAESRWRSRMQEAIAVTAALLLLGGLGVVREPVDPVPRDFYRYVDDIEREFDGLATERVLMDTGTWVYLRAGILLKDRSAPVSVHVGKNQSAINRAALAETIGRIEGRVYDKILARQIDGDGSWYDFQNHGSGVRAAILEHYQPIRVIRHVDGLDAWWPLHLVSDIVVLTPKAS